MTHYPSHKRTAFLRYLDDVCGDEVAAEMGVLPQLAMMEVDHKPQEFPAEVFIRHFLNCDDALPADARAKLSDLLGLDDGQLPVVDSPVKVNTYAEAAASLLLLLYGPTWQTISADEFASLPTTETLAGHVLDYAEVVDEVRRVNVEDSANGRRLDARRRAVGATDPDTVRALARELEGGGLKAVASEVYVTAHFTVHDAQGREVAKVSIEGEYPYSEPTAFELLEHMEATVDDLSLHPTLAPAT